MNRAPLQPARVGFTLVEMLIVIAVLGLLMALLLPAVNMARESARRVICTNHVHQLAIGCVRHLEEQGYFPTGGWGMCWTGEPDLQFGKSQPGGWVYNVLPYIDQGPLHDLGSGCSPAVARAAAKQRCETAVDVLYCPSRRLAVATPAASPTAQPYNADPVTVLGHSDYGINAGSIGAWWGGGPGSIASAATYPWPDVSQLDGISYLRSEVTTPYIRDGLSNTYLLGEKYLNPNDYYTGLDADDDQSAFCGGSQDMARFGNRDTMPFQDRPGVTHGSSYGSAHVAGWMAAFCDGSVRMMSFDIDPEMHRCLSSRNDGRLVSPEQ